MLDAGLRDCGAQSVAFGAVTGSGAALLDGPGLARAVNEVAALVEGGMFLAPQGRAIVEIGGQTAKCVTGFTATEKSRVEVSINSNCASGTGAFLEEQASRLGLSIEDFSLRAGQASNVPRIAGRCSVFAKTDITHHSRKACPSRHPAGLPMRRAQLPGASCESSPSTSRLFGEGFPRKEASSGLMTILICRRRSFLTLSTGHGRSH
jgi:hypothetical protein